MKIKNKVPSLDSLIKSHKFDWGNWELHFDELWNEHDGTHFYKDEFRDFIRSLLHEREEEMVKRIEVKRQKYQEENKITLGYATIKEAYDFGFDTALDEVINKVIKRK